MQTKGVDTEKLAVIKVMAKASKQGENKAMVVETKLVDEM